MLEHLAIISVIGGLVALDHTEALQTMFSQPLLVGLIAGFIWGDLSSGLKIGLLLQLVYLWVMPIGTAVSPDPAIGSLVSGGGFVILTRLIPGRPNLILLVILVFTVFFSLFAGWTLTRQRQLNSWLLYRADICAEKARTRGFDWLFLLSLSGSFVRGLVVTGLGMACTILVLTPLVRHLTLVPETYLQGLELTVWGLGIGSMMHLFGSGRKPLLWVAGTVLGFMVLFS
ncbi:MAG: PTS sugar transporter subunit IIC [Candidatus Zixiibacteriota bacterium]